MTFQGFYLAVCRLHELIRERVWTVTLFPDPCVLSAVVFSYVLHGILSVISIIRPFVLNIILENSRHFTLSRVVSQACKQRLSHHLDLFLPYTPTLVNLE